MAVVPKPKDKLDVHFQDTYDQFLPNILVSLQVNHQLIALAFYFVYIKVLIHATTIELS